jgi:hypothetical protein
MGVDGSRFGGRHTALPSGIGRVLGMMISKGQRGVSAVG